MGGTRGTFPPPPPPSWSSCSFSARRTISSVYLIFVKLFPFICIPPRIVYRPPNSDVTFYDKLQDACDRIQPDLHGYEGVILLGDLNINWKMESPSSTKLQEVTNSIGLTQLVEEVTRPLSNSTSTGTTIDLIFTNRPEKFTAVETIANPVSSDHHAVSFAFSANKSPPQATPYKT